MTVETLKLLHENPPQDKRTRCYTKEWLDSLTPELRQAYEAALNQSSHWKTAGIYDLAVKDGYDKQYNSLRVHRVGRCSCV